jgi:hypothetical protein
LRAVQPRPALRAGDRLLSKPDATSVQGVSAAQSWRLVKVARTNLRRFHPFKASVVLPTDEPFDARKQSWAAGALAAIEAFAGAVMALPFALSVAFCVSWLFMGTYQRQSYHFHHVSIWLFWKLGACSMLSGALLWAGLALMFGWPSRYRAHGALALVSLGLVAAHCVLTALWV